MKKLLFGLCMMGAFEISALAQSNVSLPVSNTPVNNTPVNNVSRWIRNDPFYGDNTPNHFTYISDFMGGYDVSNMADRQEVYSYFSLDLSTTPVQNLFFAVEYDIDGSLHPDQLGGTGRIEAGYVNSYESGQIPTQYFEDVISENKKNGLGSLSMTNECIPTSNDYFIEVSICAEIEWNNGNYSDLYVMYDFSLDGSALEW